MELTHLKSFTVVARTKNLSKAAQEVGTTQPNLGRQMTALANEVGITLFIRHSRGISLTAEGQEFLELCQQTIGRLDQGAALIRERKLNPSGTLKIVMGTGTIDHIFRYLPALTHKYPHLNFKFMSLADVFQFQIGDADLGLVPTKFSDPDIIQHHLYDGLQRVYASPSYIKSHSSPKTFEDLKNHKLIFYNLSDPESFKSHNILHEYRDPNNQYRAHIEVNSGTALRNALLEGLGIGSFVYERTTVEKNLLVDVFPDHPDVKIPYYFTYHKSLEGSPKIQAFYTFLKEVAEVWRRP
ncbi:MAG: LysR family transcriptional regulator [Alphaproteobacteria bacterium]|nr:LysR family transcriptional regulator [Alphaproteobacteria bacterium]